MKESKLRVVPPPPMPWSGTSSRKRSSGTLRIEAKVLRHPADLIYNILMFIQCWTNLPKEHDREALQEMASGLKAIYTSLAPRNDQLAIWDDVLSVC